MSAELLRNAENVTRMEMFFESFFSRCVELSTQFDFFRLVMQEVVVLTLFNVRLNRQKQLDNLELAMYVFFFHNEVTIEI